MAHVARWGIAGVGLILGVSLGCGGRQLDLGDGPTPDPDSGVAIEDTGIVSTEAGFPETGVVEEDTGVVGFDGGAAVGWNSYTATVTSVVTDWGSFKPSPPPGNPSKGYSMRFDLNTALSSGVRGVISPLFADPIDVIAPGAGGTTFTLRKIGAPLGLSVRSDAGFFRVVDELDAFTITLGPDGHPASATATGRTSAYSGDVVYGGNFQATVVFTPDTRAPNWRIVPVASFAPMALPWDDRIFDASESYEETLTAKGIVDSVASITLDTTKIESSAWGTRKERGLRFRPKDWQLAPTIMARPIPVHDMAGNVLIAPPSVFSFGGATVGLRTSGSMKFGDDAGAAHRWGPTDEVTEGCGAGKTCLKVGPVTWGDYCRRGSLGGLATRMKGTGIVTTRFRAVARRRPGPGPGGGFSPPPNFLYTYATTPDTPGSSGPTGTKWPDSPGADGSWDTGFVDVAIGAFKTGAETGAAISVGGTGPTSTEGCGGGPGPAPILFDLTIYVEHVSVSK